VRRRFQYAVPFTDSRPVSCNRVPVDADAAPNKGGLTRASMVIPAPPAQSPTMTLPGVARRKLPGKLGDAC
jgi:hypothetical protein